jgi:WD40 repeat protein/predicted Ser/Thr protein kinase
MAEKRLCGKCGAELTDVGPERLCPACLLEGGLDVGESVAEKPPWVVPLASRSARETAVFYSFGDYELLEEIARGGMGIVYRARQASLNRIVAVKVLISGLLASPEFVQRFRAEAAAAASLQHPNIVAIHEVGFREGQHFFAMDYVLGSSLAELTRNGPLAARRAAGYVKTIAEAIHYAHARGILHRDLKPANVLIDEKDQPHVTDFGLAKDLHKHTDLTLSGQVLGSPSYMPPEQAEARRGKVGVRSDVYSLGAVLYHLLTARPPFAADTIAKTLHQVQNDEPVSPRLLNGAVPQDLTTICLKCLEKEPEKRYATAQDLAEDLGRFLERKPILARPISRPEKFWRWCRRNPVVATLAATAALIFVLGFAGVAWQGQRASQAAANARRLGHIAQGGQYAAQMKLAHGAYQAGKIGTAFELLKAQIPAPGEPDFRGFEWRYLYRLCSGSPGEIIATNTGVFQSVAYSPDGHTVAFGTGDGLVEIFGADSHQRIKRWKAHEGAVDYLAYYPPNGNWLATTSGDDGILKLWDIEQERVLFSMDGSKGMCVDFAFSPTGRYLAARETDALSLNLWELHTSMPGAAPTVTRKANLGFLGPAVFSPDERTLFVCNKNARAAALLDLSGDGVVQLPEGAHVDFIQAAAFSRDGSKLVTGGADERVVLWDVGDHVAISRQYETDLIVPTAVALSPDNQTLFAGGWGPNIRLWNLQKTPEFSTLQGHGSGVNGMALAPDGRALASAGRDGTARIWPLAKAGLEAATQPVAPFRTLVHSKDTFSSSRGQQAVLAMAVSPHKDKVVAASDEKLLVVDLLSDAEPVCVDIASVFGVQEAGVMGIRFSSDGSQLAVGSGFGEIAFLDATTWRRTKEPVQFHNSQIWNIDFCLDGKVLITSGSNGTGIKLTEIASGRLIREIRGVEGSFPPQPTAVSPDRTLLATGSPEQRVRIWDIASGRLVTSSPENQKVRFLHALAFSPDGRLLAYADELGAIFLWDFAGARPLRKLVGHSGPVNTLAFSPDGRTLASGGMDHTVRLWHPEIDQEVAILTGHTGWVWCVAFARGGDILLSGSRDGTLKLWQAASFDEIKANERITSFHP